MTKENSTLWLANYIFTSCPWLIANKLVHAQFPWDYTFTSYFCLIVCKEFYYPAERKDTEGKQGPSKVFEGVSIEQKVRPLNIPQTTRVLGHAPPQNLGAQKCYVPRFPQVFF